MKKGEGFEKLVAEVERSIGKSSSVRIQNNVKLKTKKGNYRQIDILIEQAVERFLYRTIIECKDRKSKVNAREVNAFKTLMESVDAHQGIMVSKSGFQKGAITEAANERILLYRLSDAHNAAEYLKAALISQYQYTVKHVETIVSFQEKKEINKEVNLYSTLKVEGMPNEFSLVKIIEIELEKERTQIPKNFIKNLVVKDGMIAVTEGEATGSISFNQPVYYESRGERTVITGFESRYKIEFLLRSGEVESYKQYQDIKSSSPVAFVTGVKVGNERFNLIERIDPSKM